jgi:DNA-directed RNA polymerase subunit E'/Rpb7
MDNKMNNKNLYVIKKLKCKIELKARQIHNNINNILFNKLKEKVSNKCIEEGYIKTDSLKILHIQKGMVNMDNLNGSITFNILYEALVCNPSEGEEIECTILDINKTNVQAYIEDKDISPLKIFLNRIHHQERQDYVDLKINENIKINILYKNYEYNDNKILIFGKLI